MSQINFGSFNKGSPKAKSFTPTFSNNKFSPKFRQNQFNQFKNKHFEKDDKSQGSNSTDREATKQFQDSATNFLDETNGQEYKNVTNFLQLVAIYWMSFNHVILDDNDTPYLPLINLFQLAFPEGKPFPKQVNPDRAGNFFCEKSPYVVHPGRAIDYHTFINYDLRYQTIHPYAVDGEKFLPVAIFTKKMIRDLKWNMINFIDLLIEFANIYDVSNDDREWFLSTSSEGYPTNDQKSNLKDFIEKLSEEDFIKLMTMVPCNLNDSESFTPLTIVDSEEFKKIFPDHSGKHPYYSTENISTKSGDGTLKYSTKRVNCGEDDVVLSMIVSTRKRDFTYYNLDQLLYNFAMSILTFSSCKDLYFFNAITKQRSITGNLTYHIISENKANTPVLPVYLFPQKKEDDKSEEKSMIIQMKQVLIQISHFFCNVSSFEQIKNNKQSEWTAYSVIPTNWQTASFSIGSNTYKGFNMLPVLNMLVGFRNIDEKLESISCPAYLSKQHLPVVNVKGINDFYHSIKKTLTSGKVLESKDSMIKFHNCDGKDLLSFDILKSGLRFILDHHLMVNILKDCMFTKSNPPLGTEVADLTMSIKDDRIYGPVIPIDHSKSLRDDRSYANAADKVSPQNNPYFEPRRQLKEYHERSKEMMDIYQTSMDASPNPDEIVGFYRSAAEFNLTKELIENGSERSDEIQNSEIITYLQARKQEGAKEYPDDPNGKEKFETEISIAIESIKMESEESVSSKVTKVQDLEREISTQVNKVESSTTMEDFLTDFDPSGAFTKKYLVKFQENNIEVDDLFDIDIQDGDSSDLEEITEMPKVARKKFIKYILSQKK